MGRLRKYWLLLLILLAAGFLRFYQLAQIPPSPSLDEVSTAWNAYSILQTGADEYGYKFPILLRAYDDWRPAGCTYLTIPFVGIFGLSATATRLPFAILSMITILAVYFLVKELFYNSSNANHYALISTFLLAISPWHIYISRLGHDTQAGLALSVLAILFFLKAINSKRRSILFFVLSAAFWAVSFYTYQSQKIFGPLMIFALGLFYRDKLRVFKKEIFLAAIVGSLITIPIFKASLSPEALARFRGTSVFSSESLSTPLRSYFSHFDLSWLFFNGGGEKHKVPGLGVLYLWELPLLLLGVYRLAKGNFPKPTNFLLLTWALVAPLPAAITTEAPHAMRAFNMLPVPQIIAAIGAASLISGLKLRLWFAPAILIILASMIYLYHNYFVNFPREQSASFQYPLAQAIPYVLKESDKYEKIVFSNQGQLYQSYMFFLFYSHYDPKLYQLQGGTVSGGFAETHKIGKYEFRPIAWPKEEKNNTLFIGNLSDFPAGVVPEKIFSLLNNQAVVGIYGQK